MNVEFDKLVERVAEIAQESFWREVADQFPEIKAGDLNPYSTTLFSLQCENVIKEWIATNGERDENGIVTMTFSEPLDKYFK